MIVDFCELSFPSWERAHYNNHVARIGSYSDDFLHMIKKIGGYDTERLAAGELRRRERMEAES